MTLVIGDNTRLGPMVPMDELEQVPTAARSAAERLSDLIRANSSPLGMLGLPELLDQRRLEYGIPDGAFQAECLYDRIFVYQLPEHTSKTFVQGGLILMPENVESARRHSTPRGILVGAGMQARDVMLSHGIELGHIVRFIRLAPYNMEIANLEGHSLTVLVMKIGDLTASEDLREALRSGDRKLAPEFIDPLKPQLGRYHRLDTETAEDY